MSQAAAGTTERDESTLSRDIERDIDDMLTALRSVGHSGGTVIRASGNALERELDMAVRLSEQIRDSVISPAALAEARENEFSAQMRADAHRLVDLVADFSGVAVLQVAHFADGLLGSRGPSTAAPGESVEST